jgi:hypothetical protein
VQKSSFFPTSSPAFVVYVIDDSHSDYSETLTAVDDYIKNYQINNPNPYLN